MTTPLRPKPLLSVFVILALTVCCYGLLAPWLGFYKDDWRNLWSFYTFGTQGILDLLAVDRPYCGYLYALTTSIFGIKPANWHFFAVGSRALCSLAFWLTLSGLWPSRRRTCLSLTLLFAVYPGYTQYVWALTHSHIILHLAVVLGSFAALVWSFRLKRAGKLLFIISLLLGLHGVLQSEYFLGLELAARPLLIWAMLVATSGIEKPRVSRLFKIWSTYLFFIAGSLIWRVFFFNPPIEGNYDVRAIFGGSLSNPLQMLRRLIGNAITDFIELTFLAWTQTISNQLVSAGVIYSVCWLLIAAVAVFCFWGLSSQTDEPSVEPGNGEAQMPLVAAGMVILLGGMAPFWIAGRSVVLASITDRFALGGMVGATFLAYALISGCCRSSRHTTAVVAILCGFSTSFHFLNMNDYRRDWRHQREVLWQIAWRMPNLEPGTALVTDDLPMIDRRGFQFSIPINILYSGEPASHQLRHWVCNASVEVGYHTQRLDEDSGFFIGYVPGFQFEGNLRKSVAITIESDRTVRVLQPDGRPDGKPLLRALAFFSRPELIRKDPPADNAALRSIIGPEPAHRWWYFFQKASLAAQFQEWEIIESLADAVEEKKLAPKNPSHWLVFIEAALRTGNLERATRLSRQAVGEMSVLQLDLVNLVKSLEKGQDPMLGRFKAEILDQPPYINGWWPNGNHTR